MCVSARCHRPVDHVVLVRAREASLALEKKFVPVDLAIVGVVDELEVVEGGEFDLRLGHTRYT